MENWTPSTPNLAQKSEMKAPAKPSAYGITAVLLATASVTQATPAQAAPEVEPEFDETTQVAAAPAAIAVTDSQTAATVESTAPLEWADAAETASIQPVETAPVYAAPLQWGSQGERVSELQQQLNAWGYEVAVDGDFGAQTHHAVAHFQAQQNLPQDGIVGPNTATVLAASQAYQASSSSNLYSSGAAPESTGYQVANHTPVSQPVQVAPAQVQYGQPPANKVKTINIKRSPKTAAKPTPAPTLHLEPFNLVYLGYQGYFRDQGIPSLGAFADAAYRRRITPEDLIRAAAAQNRLDERLLQDEGYVNAVRAAIRGILSDRSETE